MVRLHAAGVNPVDVDIRSAAQGRNPVLPYVPGMDGAGVVDVLGTSVDGWAIGDRVLPERDVARTAERHLR